MTGLTLHHIMREPGTGTRSGAPVLILLHGVRSNEQDLMELAPALDPRFFVFSARAPIALGPSAYGWYHVEFAPTGYILDEDEAEQGRDVLLRFTGEAAESYGVDPARIFLMGFSQGAVMSLSAALREPVTFAGAVAMSGRPLDRSVSSAASPEQLRGLPLMVVHRTGDTVIAVQFGRAIRDALASLPVNVDYREYGMGHQVTGRSLADINSWLGARLDAGDWRTGRA